MAREPEAVVGFDEGDLGCKWPGAVAALASVYVSWLIPSDRARFVESGRLNSTSRIRCTLEKQRSLC